MQNVEINKIWFEKWLSHYIETEVDMEDAYALDANHVRVVSMYKQHRLCITQRAIYAGTYNHTRPSDLSRTKLT